jgi:hypothetical protein
MNQPTNPAAAIRTPEAYHLLRRDYANPKAVVAAMRAAAYKALAESHEREPTAEATRLCPRSVHYRRMADIWQRAADIFDNATFGPSGIEPWMGADD